jgi:hypothetical protein
MKEADPGLGPHEAMEPLDPELAAALAALPRTREPGDLLEERTVRRLRSAGVLGRRATFRREWLAVAVAASLAVFASGVATGQWLGARQAASTLAAHQQATLEEMSALVRQTGSAYVSALSLLAESNVVAEPAQAEHAREAAVQFLHQAANQVVRMAPNDPVTARILQGFDHAALQAPPEGGERHRQIVWF